MPTATTASLTTMEQEALARIPDTQTYRQTLSALLLDYDVVDQMRYI